MDYTFLDINFRVDKLQDHLKWDISQEEINSLAKAILARVDIVDKKEILRGNKAINTFYLFAQTIVQSVKNGYMMDLVLSSERFDDFLKGAFEVGEYSDFSSRYIEKILAFLSYNDKEHRMAVLDIFDKIKSKERFIKNPKLLKDIRRLFIKNGDIELFLNCNLANAIRCYKSADIYEYCLGLEDPFIPLSEDEWSEVVSWHAFVNVLNPAKLATNLNALKMMGIEDIANGAYKYRKQIDFNLDFEGRILQGSYLAFYADYIVSVIAIVNDINNFTLNRRSIYAILLLEVLHI